MWVDGFLLVIIQDIHKNNDDMNSLALSTFQIDAGREGCERCLYILNKTDNMNGMTICMELR